MIRRPDARTLLFEKIRTSPAKFVHVTGVPYVVELEAHNDPEHVDHVWITLEVPPFGRIRAVVNTFSRLNRMAGCDSRVRVAIVTSPWEEKPQAGLVEERGQDYSLLEAVVQPIYEPMEQEVLAALLMQKAKAALRAEVWGDLYARDHLGVHQIHCRRASQAVPLDLKNRDGALKLYYSDQTADLFLFKFFGQP